MGMELYIYICCSPDVELNNEQNSIFSSQGLSYFFSGSKPYIIVFQSFWGRDRDSEYIQKFAGKGKGLHSIKTHKEKLIKVGDSNRSMYVSSMLSFLI